MATKNTALRNKEGDDWRTLFAGGTLVIKDAGAVTLATFTLGSPAWGAFSGGVGALAGAPINTTGSAGGTAASAELHSTSSTYTITGLTVGVGSGQVQLDNLSIASGQQLSLTALSYTVTATVS
jgi:hypothetical protein